MSFIPDTSQGLIPGVGNINADILILGDCLDTYARKNSKPIAGPAEGVLQDCLHQASLTQRDVYFDNFLPDIHTDKLYKFWNERSKKIVGNVDGYKQRIDAIIQKVDPKIIVALGEISAKVLTDNGMTAKTRGYPFKREGYQIIIPAQHPRSMIWTNYIGRYYLSHDLNKARKLCENSSLLYNPEIEIKIPQTFEEAKETLKLLRAFSKLSVDIEVANYEVSCIGFAPRADLAYSIPTDMRWTLAEEVELWNLIADILADTNISKIGQNFIFDIHFLIYRMGIFTYGPIIDTMMSHSIMYPEFLKSLNFLASIHTFQPYWKDMVKFKDIKAES
jgi:DNA polymerase